MSKMMMMMNQNTDSTAELGRGIKVIETTAED